MTIVIEGTDDPRRAFEECGALLAQRPVEHNVALSILTERLAHPVDGRYWWARADGEIVGYAWQSPTTFFAGVTPMPVAAAQALATRVAADAATVPGVIGEARTAASFAGRWTEVRGGGATPDEGQRIYRLDAVVPLDRPSGRTRTATTADTEQLVAWMHAFHDETGDRPPDVTATVRRRVEEGWYRVWEDGEVAAAAMVVPEVAGAVRIGFVYTPPARRRRGYAQALVADVSAHALGGGATACVLYTQLANPTSNSIYRRVGYRAVSEVLRYRF